MSDPDLEKTTRQEDKQMEHSERSPEILEASASPKIPRKTGRVLCIIGLVCFGLGMLGILTLAVLEQKSFIPLLALGTLLSWIIWKVGKSINRMHNIADYEQKRNREIQDASSS